MFGKRPGPEAALLAGSAVGCNLGLFAYPFSEAVWGAMGLATAVVYDLMNQVSLLIVQYGTFRHYSVRGSLGTLLTVVTRRMRHNPCLLALYLSLALCVLQLPLPSAVASVTAPLVRAHFLHNGGQ